MFGASGSNQTSGFESWPEASVSLVWLHYLPHWGQTPETPAIRDPLANLMSGFIGTIVLLLWRALIFQSSGRASTERWRAWSLPARPLSGARTLCPPGSGRECSADPVNAGAAQPAHFGQQARRPMRGMARRGFGTKLQDAIDVRFAQLSRRSRPGRIQQTVETLLDKTLPPLTHGLQGDIQLRGRARVGTTRRAKQNQAGAQCERLRTLRTPGPCQKGLAFVVGQQQRMSGASRFHPLNLQERGPTRVPPRRPPVSQRRAIRM